MTSGSQGREGVDDVTRELPVVTAPPAFTQRPVPQRPADAPQYTADPVPQYWEPPRGYWGQPWPEQGYGLQYPRSGVGRARRFAKRVLVILLLLVLSPIALFGACMVWSNAGDRAGLADPDQPSTGSQVGGPSDSSNGADADNGNGEDQGHGGVGDIAEDVGKGARDIWEGLRRGWGSGGQDDAGTDAAPSASTGTGAARSALQALDSLPGPANAPGDWNSVTADNTGSPVFQAGTGRTGWFGPAWADVDRNGCDTRNDVLDRDLSDKTVADNGCQVLAGVLDDPYTGSRISFKRGKDTSSAVQIDHVVPLHYAYVNGAWQWDAQKRLAFANDMDNLLAVDGPANQAKGDKGPASWMPGNTAYHCEYAQRFVSVSSEYGLGIPEQDKAALRDALASCAD